MAKKQTVKFTRALPFVKNLVFIDGITRCGKFWLANFLNHMNGVEPFRHEQFMDHISIYNHFGLIDSNAAVNALRGMVDLYAFENAVGRNINFKLSDHSCIYKNPKMQEYLSRVYGPDRKPQEVFEDLKKSERYFVFITHDWLSHLGVQLQAFPDMKLLRIRRNPIDLVNAWYSTGIGLGRMAFGQTIEGIKGPVPWFVHSWMDEFEKMREMDRIIEAILFLDNSSQNNFAKLSAQDKKKVFFTSYEAMAARPLDEAKAIAQFLGTTLNDTIYSFCAAPVFSKRTAQMMQRSRQDKLLFIKEKAGKKSFAALQDRALRYEEIVQI